jgi:hypothetical protein
VGRSDQDNQALHFVDRLPLTADSARAAVEVDAMQSEAVLRDHVGQLRRRVRLLVTARWVFAALLVVSLLCSVLVICDRLEWISAPPEYLAGLLLLGTLVGAVVGFTRPVSLMEAARLADRRLGLKERLSSGIDFIQSGASDPMTAAQLADAAEHSRQLRPREVFPFRAPREAKFFLGSLVLLIALIFVPELALFQSPAVRAEKQAMRTEGKRIEKLAKEYRRHDAQKNSEITRRIAANMQALGREMRRGRVGKKQAMLRMGRLSKEMRDAQRQLALANMPRSMDQAAQDLKRSAENAQRRGANPAGAKMLADMALALENKDYQAAAQMLQQLAQKMQSGDMKPGEAKAAAEALAKMAQAMKGTQLDAAAKQMQQAAKQLAAASKLSAPQMQQAMRQAMNQAGKSCAQAGGT